FTFRKVSSASGPTTEKEFLRSTPPVKITSTGESASSAAIFVALVIIVKLLNARHALAIAIVVVPESRMITCPCRIICAAAAAMRIFSGRCIRSFSPSVRSFSAPIFSGSAPPCVLSSWPSWCSDSRSLRMVISEVRNRFARSFTNTRPSECSSSNISRRRSSLSIETLISRNSANVSALGTLSWASRFHSTRVGVVVDDFQNPAVNEFHRIIQQFLSPDLFPLFRQILAQQRKWCGILCQVSEEPLKGLLNGRLRPVIPRAVAIAVFPRKMQRRSIPMVITFPVTGVRDHRMIKRLAHPRACNPFPPAAPFLFDHGQSKHGFAKCKCKPRPHLQDRQVFLAHFTQPFGLLIVRRVPLETPLPVLFAKCRQTCRFLVIVGEHAAVAKLHAGLHNHCHHPFPRFFQVHRPKRILRRPQRSRQVLRPRCLRRRSIQLLASGNRDLRPDHIQWRR